MNRFFPETAAASALMAAVIAFATIAGAWIFQGLGYPPCDLCYEQRYAYYVGVPLAALVFVLVRAGARHAIVVAGLAALALIFAEAFWGPAAAKDPTDADWMIRMMVCTQQNSPNMEATFRNRLCSGKSRLRRRWRVR